MEKKKGPVKSTAKRSSTTSGSTPVDPFAAVVEKPVLKAEIPGETKRAIKVIKKAKPAFPPPADIPSTDVNDAFAEPVSSSLTSESVVPDIDPPMEEAKPKRTRAKRALKAEGPSKTKK